MKADYPSEFCRAELIQNTSTAPSSLIAFHRNKFNEIDGFDESFSVFNSDYDFSIRLKNNGYYNVIVPECKAIHIQSKRRLLQYAADIRANIELLDKELFVSRYSYLITRPDPYYNANYPLKRKNQQITQEEQQKIYQEEQKKTYVANALLTPKSNNLSKLVTYIIPWYEHIPTTITSLLVQTHSNIEILVMYDGECPQKYRDYINALKDDRIKFSCTDKHYNDWGHTPRNKSIDLINKDSFAVVFTGMDNYYLPPFTSELLDPLCNLNIVATYCDMIHNIFKWNLMPTRLQLGHIDCGCFMTRSSIAKEFGWGNKVDWEDWIFIEKIMKKYGAPKIKKINRMLYIHN